MIRAIRARDYRSVSVAGAGAIKVSLLSLRVLDACTVDRLNRQAWTRDRASHGMDGERGERSGGCGIRVLPCSVSDGLLRFSNIF